jgi:hypothetical protein
VAATKSLWRHSKTLFKGFDFGPDMIYSLGNKVYFGSRAGLLDQFGNNNSRHKRKTDGRKQEIMLNFQK